MLAFVKQVSLNNNQTTTRLIEKSSDRLIYWNPNHDILFLTVLYSFIAAEKHVHFLHWTQ